MKKIKGIAAWGILLIFVVLIVAALVLPTFGRRITGTTEDIIGTYAGVGSGQSDNVKASMDLAHTDLDALIATGVDVQGLLGLGGVGVVWYVDSTATGTDAGTSWTNACPTLEEAIVLALAATGDDGDIILVAAGHIETLTATDDVDFDVAGIKAIGLGVGENRPTFTYTTNGEIVIGAADVEIHNMNFIAGDGVTNAILVATGADGWLVNNCRFSVTTLDTHEFTFCIITAANADNGRVTNCRFEMGAASADAAIQNVGCDFIEISNNIFTGDYSTACIEDVTTASIWLIIDDNILVNGTGGTYGLNTLPCIAVKSTSTAIITNNTLFTNVASSELAIVAAQGLLAGNTFGKSAGTFTGSMSMDKAQGSLHTTVATTSAMTISNGYDQDDDPAIFTVTGDILCRACATFTTQITSTSTDTLNLGVVGAEACFLVQDAADGTAFDAGDTWTLGVAADDDGAQMADEWVVVSGGDIKLYIDDHGLTAGVTNFYLEWVGLSADASVADVAP